jgi:hypothetical protein
MNETVERLERRVARLERSNRLLAVGLGLVLVGGLAAATSSQVVDEVRARRIRIVDADDRVRIDLRHDDEETGLFILDANGDTRLGAAQFAHGGGGYALHGPGGRGAAVLYLRGEGSLTMYETDGTVAARFPAAGGAPEAAR